MTIIYREYGLNGYSLWNHEITFMKYEILILNYLEALAYFFFTGVFTYIFNKWYNKCSASFLGTTISINCDSEPVHLVLKIYNFNKLTLIKIGKINPVYNFMNSFK